MEIGEALNEGTANVDNAETMKDSETSKESNGTANVVKVKTVKEHKASNECSITVIGVNPETMNDSETSNEGKDTVSSVNATTVDIIEETNGGNTLFSSVNATTVDIFEETNEGNNLFSSVNATTVDIIEETNEGKNLFNSVNATTVDIIEEANEGNIAAKRVNAKKMKDCGSSNEGYVTVIGVNAETMNNSETSNEGKVTANTVNANTMNDSDTSNEGNVAANGMNAKTMNDSDMSNEGYVTVNDVKAETMNDSETSNEGNGTVNGVNDKSMENSVASNEDNVNDVNVKIEASETPSRGNDNAGLNIKTETMESGETSVEANGYSCVNIKIEKNVSVTVKKELVEDNAASATGRANPGVKIKVEGVSVKQESDENSEAATNGYINSGMNIKREPVESSSTSEEGVANSGDNIKKETQENGGEMTTEGHVNPIVNVKTEEKETKEEVCVTPLREYNIVSEEETVVGNDSSNITVIERYNSITPRKRSWIAANNGPASGKGVREQYSLEEGELTPSVLVTGDSVISVESKRERRPSKRLCYSSFIETSKEEGECSTTFMTDTSDDDVEVTVIENVKKGAGSIAHKNSTGNVLDTMEICSVTIDTIIQECTGIYNQNEPFEGSKTVLGSNTSASFAETDQTLKCSHENGGTDCSLCVNGIKSAKKTTLKRELSSDCYYENTPKRPHLFVPEDSEKHLLSPIQKVSQGISSEVKMSDIETPLITSKFQGSSKDICSTPMSKSDVSEALKPAATERDNKLCANTNRRTFGSANTFTGFDDQPSSIQPDDIDKMITVDELVADITALCESINASLESSASANDSDVNDADLKAVDENKNDKTLTEETEVVNNVSEVAPGRGCADIDDDISVIIDEITKHNKAEAEPVNESEKSTGRFKDLHVVSKIDLTVVEDDKKLLDIDADEFDSGDDDCVIDILCLEKYDEEEADVDQKVLEKSHFAAAVERSISVEQVKDAETESLKAQIQTDAKVEKKVLVSKPPPKDVSKKSEKVEDKIDHSTKPTDAVVVAPVRESKITVPTELDLSKFDANTYRKNVESFAEVEACRRWGTTNIGTPRADVNLTVATNFHINKTGVSEGRSNGYLECDSVSCAYLCEDATSCKINKLSCTSSDQKYMDVDAILCRLENQRQLLVDMRHDSLVHLRGKIERKKSEMRKCHVHEYNDLIQRHGMQLDDFMFQTRASTDHKIPNDLQQLRNKHSSEINVLKKHHLSQFSALSAEGKELLNELVNRYDFQAEPIDEIMEQLNFNYNKYYREGLWYKFGPPVGVHLRKGPCRDNNWTHSTVRVFLPAGIAQALSLEEDLYDQHYAW